MSEKTEKIMVFIAELIVYSALGFLCVYSLSNFEGVWSGTLDVNTSPAMQYIFVIWAFLRYFKLKEEARTKRATYSFLTIIIFFTLHLILSSFESLPKFYGIIDATFVMVFFVASLFMPGSINIKYYMSSKKT